MDAHMWVAAAIVVMVGITVFMDWVATPFNRARSSAGGADGADSVGGADGAGGAPMVLRPAHARPPSAVRFQFRAGFRRWLQLSMEIPIASDVVAVVGMVGMVGMVGGTRLFDWWLPEGFAFSRIRAVWGIGLFSLLISVGKERASRISVKTRPNFPQATVICHGSPK